MESNRKKKKKKILTEYMEGFKKLLSNKYFMLRTTILFKIQIQKTGNTDLYFHL